MTDLASIIIVTYNCQHYMNSCLESVMAQDYPNEIIVVDNASSDGTVDFVRKKFPSVIIIENSSDLGFGSGSNIGVAHAKGKYIVLLNPDTIVQEHWLRELILPIQNNEKLITTSKILKWDGKTINTCGNSIHYSGLAFTTHLGDSRNQCLSPQKVSALSGASFAMTKEAYDDLGGFDESIFLYHEDVELSWRAALMGYDIQTVPSSLLKHDYQLNVSPQKIYYLEFGRYIILKKYYSRKDCLLLFPSLIIAEILAWGYAIKSGKNGIHCKIRAIHEGLPKQINKVNGNKRRMYQILDTTIPTDQLTTNCLETTVIKIANVVFRLNRTIVSNLK